MGSEGGGGAPPPPPPPPGGEGEAAVTPESRLERLNILVENNVLEGASFINLSQGRDSLGEIDKQLDKLLNL
jgi:hypothetical protein